MTVTFTCKPNPAVEAVGPVERVQLLVAETLFDSVREAVVLEDALLEPVLELDGDAPVLQLAVAEADALAVDEAEGQTGGVATGSCHATTAPTVCGYQQLHEAVRLPLPPSPAEAGHESVTDRLTCATPAQGAVAERHALPWTMYAGGAAADHCIPVRPAATNVAGG